MQYLSDTPDGAWAEFLRHEEITELEDLAGIGRRIWAVELPDESCTKVDMPDDVARGGYDTYPACQDAAHSLREGGATMLEASSAALVSGGARGQVTASGLREASGRDGTVWAVFGPRPDLRGWATAHGGSPPPRLLGLVNHFPGVATASASRNQGDNLEASRRRAERRGDIARRNVIDLDIVGVDEDRRDYLGSPTGVDRRSGDDRRSDVPNP